MVKVKGPANMSTLYFLQFGALLLIPEKKSGADDESSRIEYAMDEQRELPLFMR